MSKTPLGRLEQLDLRAYWESEPRDFTPWLAEDQNIALLGKTLGIEFEVQETEAGVGSFSADIVCRNTADNSVVLIENQLERTDHTHLGQLFTYASGLDAVTTIWIASRFTEEHRAAVDWLNSITHEDFNFFGLEIELWKIGDSPPAPKFNVVSKPNNWSKMVREISSSPKRQTPTQKSLIEFWDSFAEFLESKERPFSPPKPQPSNWVAWGLGRTGFALQASAGFWDGRVAVYVAMEGPDAKSHFHQVHAFKDDIERDAGFSLDWQERPDIQTSYVSIRKDIDLDDRSIWPEVHSWMLDHLLGVDRAFRPRIKDLDASDWRPENDLDLAGSEG